MSKRIMVFGASGQIGLALQNQNVPKDWELGAFSRQECDVTNHKQVHETIQKFKPDLIINSAAMTAVDACEQNHTAARAANFEAPSNLALQCAAHDIPIIHISTDYVFDGEDDQKPYGTDDPMSPINAYGHTKMMGEEAVRHGVAWHIILRVSSVFSQFAANLLTKTLKNIEEKDEISAVTDQVSSPTYAPDIAAAMVTMAEEVLMGKTTGFGTFHLCGQEALNRYEFTEAIMNAYAPFTARRPKIIPALTSDFPGFAPRPHYSVLDCSRIKKIYGIEQKSWLTGLEASVQALMANRREVA